VELDSKLGEAKGVSLQLQQASSAISQLQSQLQAERERTTQMEKARDAAVSDARESSFALRDEMQKSAALSKELQDLQKGIENAQYAVQETTQQLQAARNEAHHLQSALAQTQVCTCSVLVGILMPLKAHMLTVCAAVFLCCGLITKNSSL
jgi:predicted  nucleic acid-binding Zn-ribbon protein